MSELDRLREMSRREVDPLDEIESSLCGGECCELQRYLVDRIRRAEDRALSLGMLVDDLEIRLAAGTESERLARLAREGKLSWATI